MMRTFRVIAEKTLTVLRRLYISTAHPLTAAFLFYFGCLLSHSAIQDRTIPGNAILGVIALASFGSIGCLVYYSIRWWKPVRFGDSHQ